MGCILFSQASSGVNFLLVECVRPALQQASQFPKNSRRAIEPAFLLRFLLLSHHLLECP